MATRSIATLREHLADLQPEDRETFDRLFQVSGGTGQLVIPDAMLPWVKETYGDPAQLTEQRIVRVTDRWTLHTALFNPFRSRRPQKEGDSDSLANEIFGDGPDPFDSPERDTSEDVFGRIYGEYCMTASNLAKSDIYHGVIIFNEHNPWVLTEDALWDAFQVADAWFERCVQEDPQARYPLLMWNCLWRSAASINHAHMQLLVTSGMHYGEVERLRRVAERYREEHGSGYFDDLFRAHTALRLAVEHQGTRVLAHVAPLLANECVILGDDMNEAFARTVHRVIRLLNEELGVTSFNLVVTPRPLSGTSEDWSAMPVVAHIVDRGDPRRRAVDVGAVELFAASVITSDPFSLGELLGSLDS